MAFIRSANPAFRNGVFTRAVPGTGAMTMSGTIAKSSILVALCFASTLYTWSRVSAGSAGSVGFIGLVGVFGGFLVALLTIFQPQLAPVTSPLYAVLEGLALGVISAMYEARYRGLPRQAVTITFLVFAAVLVLYGMRVLRASTRLRSIVITATGSVVIYYALDLILYLGGGAGLPLIRTPSTAGIIFTAIVAGLAATYLILDFDMIEEGVESKAPKYLEWYAGFSLLVTLIWLYLQILRLLRKLRSR